MSEIPKTPEDREKCPFHKIVDSSEAVRIECHRIFGGPRLQKQNNLGGIHGTEFADWIEDFAAKRTKNIEIPHPGEMRDIELPEIPGIYISPDIFNRLDISLGARISNLGHVLFFKFTKEIAKVKIGEGLNPTSDFVTLSMAFIRAFDSIFITALRSVETLEDWSNLQKSIWKVVMNLSQIPTHIQEVLVGSNDKFLKNSLSKGPYMLEDMKTITHIMSHNDGLGFNQRTQMKGYARCPAIGDGVMKRSFDALHQIYGEIFLSAK